MLRVKLPHEQGGFVLFFKAAHVSCAQSLNGVACHHDRVHTIASCDGAQTIIMHA